MVADVPFISRKSKASFVTPLKDTQLAPVFMPPPDVIIGGLMNRLEGKLRETLLDIYTLPYALFIQKFAE